MSSLATEKARDEAERAAAVSRQSRLDCSGVVVVAVSNRSKVQNMKDNFTGRRRRQRGGTEPKKAHHIRLGALQLTQLCLRQSHCVDQLGFEVEFLSECVRRVFGARCPRVVVTASGGIGISYPSNIACRDNRMWRRMLDFWSAHFTSEGWVTFLRGASYELEQSLKLDGDLSVRVIDWDTAHLGEMGNFVEHAQVGFRVRFEFAHHDQQFVQALLKLDKTDARWGKLSSGVKALIDEAFSEVIGAHVGTKRLQDFQKR